MGCNQCEGGFYRITQCPQKYIGPQLIADINIVAQCTNGVMPVSGGLLDQSAYWFELKSRLDSEQNHIEREQAERRKRG